MSNSYCDKVSQMVNNMTPGSDFPQSIRLLWNHVINGSGAVQ